MAITHCPEGASVRQIVNCAVCGKQKPLQALSVGMRSPTGEQAFACDTHLVQSRQLIVGWTDFMIAESTLLHSLFTDAAISETNYVQAVY